MLPLLILLANLSSPTAADVQTAEKAWVLKPITDYTRDGRAYVEFAPTVETRNAACTLVSSGVFECTFESRVKDALAQDLGHWTSRRTRLIWKGGCWVQD